MNWLDGGNVNIYSPACFRRCAGKLGKLINPRPLKYQFDDFGDCLTSSVTISIYIMVMAGTILKWTHKVHSQGLYIA